MAETRAMHFLAAQHEHERRGLLEPTKHRDVPWFVCINCLDLHEQVEEEHRKWLAARDEQEDRGDEPGPPASG